jgi:hypothetical protein
MRWSKKHVTVATGTTVPNTSTASGQTGNPPNRPSVGRFAAIASVAGVLVTLVVGTEVLLQDQELMIRATTEGIRLIDDTVIPSFGIMPGEAVTLSFRNTNAGNADITWLIDVVPAG